MQGGVLSNKKEPDLLATAAEIHESSLDAARDRLKKEEVRGSFSASRKRPPLHLPRTTYRS